jgi:hypothetical protein
MSKLVLGVDEVPYSHSANLGKTKTGKTRVSTTFEVAEILEEKYGVMAFFWNKYKEDLLPILEQNLADEFNAVMDGKTPGSDAFAASSNAIDARFQHFLDSKEMDHQVPGVPTAASLGGKSLRFKRKRGPVRPSFIDTGLYESHFRSWVEWQQ